MFPLPFINIYTCIYIQAVFVFPSATGKVQEVAIDAVNVFRRIQYNRNFFGPLRKQKHAISSICTEKHEEFRIILLYKQGSYFEFLKCLVDLHIAFNTNIWRHNYIFFNRCVKMQKYCICLKIHYIFFLSETVFQITW